MPRPEMCIRDSVYVDGIYLRRNWGGEYENIAVLVAIAVNEDGFREVLGAAEGMKEDKASWVSLLMVAGETLLPQMCIRDSYRGFHRL